MVLRVAGGHHASLIGCCGAFAITRRVRGAGKIDVATAQAALEMLEVDRYAFDEIDRKLLLTIIEKYQGAPVGLNTLAASLAEEA